MAFQLLHSLTELPYTPSTIDEESSYWISQNYETENPGHIRYTDADFSQPMLTKMCDTFAVFQAKVQDLEGKIYQSYFPINVFRYILQEDMTWTYYYTPRKKPGYVVEGAYWSNGMFYQVREDKQEDFEVYEISLYVDRLTQLTAKFPEVIDDKRSDTHI